MEHNKMNIFQDWNANKGNFKGRFIMVAFRMAHLIRTQKVFLIFFFWYLLLYRILIEWILNIEINWNAKIGKGLKLYHGQGLVIYTDVEIGDDCTLRHHTTLGNKELEEGGHTSGPTLGRQVNIGANVVIIGEIHIGDNVTIGAGSVIVKNVPANTVVVGNPGRVIKVKNVK